MCLFDLVHFSIVDICLFIVVCSTIFNIFFRNPITSGNALDLLGNNNKRTMRKIIPCVHSFGYRI